MDAVSRERTPTAKLPGGANILLSGEFLGPDGIDKFQFSLGPIQASDIAPFSCGVQLYSLDQENYLVDSRVYGESAFQALQLATDLIANLSGWADALKQP